MFFYSSERVGLFIDGVDLHATGRALGLEIDFRRLLDLFREGGRLVCAHYYTVLGERHEYGSLQPFLDWLAYNGYTTVTKRVKDVPRPSGRRREYKMDIDLAVDALRLAESLDHIVLMSGNGDFRSLVMALQEKGKRVSILSTLATEPPMVADELRRAADQFIDIAALEAEISRLPEA